MEFIDQARDIRKGEELDNRALEAFLRDSIAGLEGPMVLKQFPGGHSNLTYLVNFDNRELVIRRPPHGTKAKTAHDMGREYNILSALHPVYPYCPKPLAYTEDESVMGCTFYVMERLRGVVLRKTLPSGITFSSEQALALCRKIVETQYELHSVDYKKAGLENFGKPEGYVQRQVEGWSKRYRNARTPDAPDCEDVMAWLADKMSGESGITSVIHNDFKLDNVVLDPENATNIIGVLDWEMATIGDPIMDLGCSMAYWLEKGDPEEMEAMRFMPPEIQAVMSRQEVVDYYSELSGVKVENFDFYYVFGLFRLAVIAQQIYYRYYHGQTQDERFKMMIMGVHVLNNQATRVIAGSVL